MYHQVQAYMECMYLISIGLCLPLSAFTCDKVITMVNHMYIISAVQGTEIILEAK